ncbi:MAG TPA: hypothetical protein DEG17_13170 [Cyanobacteria bacterium UBA11149]|nr:hypothetical protein [Cyanobacteria bacterium UBA11367]HBE60522.1 hypothetical protein [Cyanobacteria bacterium UBA11366]HBK66588.1 hypothetical protein [Cyanobacteria bacterium UBA11166]HBR75080.1 hypothetical protein [Cyanobacteria bacterium UBA11159]HBS71281.1 hypothetical protein [Cyanobacteria bacterium UBA11153]HBW89791.1 hypothetical protein [Cyanobacteria bacterium UBA11149]HCA96081.1 hypothetical protein [Cyanobacteria bacterium UBA9226]
MTKRLNWIEVWIDTYASYVLVLRGYEDGSIELYDPQKGRGSESSFDSYEEAYLWLREDEYDLAEGRMEMCE